jgi:O-antigen/teichoic acid export membrane protein
MTASPDRSARVLRGLSTQSISQALVLAVTFLIVPITIAKLGEANYGLWMVAYGALNYLVLCDFGLSATMARELAHRLGRREPPERIRPLLERTFHSVLWLTASATVLLAIACFALGPHIEAKWIPIREPFAVLVFAYLLVFPLSVFGHAIIGLSDLSFYWLAKSLQQLVASAVTVLLLLGDYGLMGMVWGFLAGHWLIVAMFVGRILWKYPDYFPRHLAALRHPETRTSLSAGFWFTANALGNVFLGGLDLLILGEILDLPTVTMYALTIRLPNTLSTQLLLVIWTLMPSLAEASTDRTASELARVLTTLFLCQAILVGLVMAVVGGVNASFIAVWVPEHPLFGGHLLNAAFLVCVFLRQIQAMSAQMLFSLGFNRLGPLTTLADGLVTAGLMIAFVIWLGPLGVPLAGILGALCISLPMNLMALGRTVGVSTGKLLAPLGGWFLRLLPVLILSAVVAYCGRFASGWWEHAGVVVFGSAIIAVAYALLMLPLLGGTPLAVKLPKRLLNHGN